MTTTFNLPTHQDLGIAPELAAVAGPSLALEILVRALGATHPVLSDEDFPRGASESARIADAADGDRGAVDTPGHSS